MLLAALLLLSALAVPVVAEDPAGSTDGRQQTGYAVSGFENIKTTGSNLIESFRYVYEKVDGNYSMTGYYTTLQPNTWYYLKYTESADMTGTVADGYYFYKQDEIIFSYPNSYLELLFFTGTGSGTCEFLLGGDVEGRQSDIGIDKYSFYQVASFDMLYDARYTSFAEDHAELFPEIDLAKYQNVTEDFIELITIYEDIEIAEDYTWDGQVYLYLFTGRSEYVTGGTLTCPDDDGNSTSFSLVPVSGGSYYPEYDAANFWQYGHFWKLEVTGHWWHMYLENADGTPNIHSRKREITDLTLTYADETSKTFPYNGEIKIEDKLEGGKVTGAAVTGDFESKVNLEINYTYYRTDTSPEGAYYHNQVDSIYFNVPNYLKELYGKLVDVKLSYQRARTQPIFVTDSSVLNDYLQAMVGKDLSTYNEALPSLYWITSSYSNGINFGLTCNCQLGDIGSFLSPYVLRSSRVVDRLMFAFLVEDVDAGVREAVSAVPREELVDWLYAYSIEVPDSFVGPILGYQGANGMISGDLFSEVDGVSVVNVESLNLEADSFKENHGFFSQWANYGFAYALGGTSTDVGLDLSQKIVAIEREWQVAGNSDKLYYAEADEKDLRECLRKSEATNSTMYLVRFNVSQYYQHPLQVDMDGETYNDIAYMAEQDIYLNLHVLELTYENEVGVRTVVPVSSNHIDAVADVTTEKTPEQIEKQAGQELAAKTESFLQSLLDKLGAFGKIFGLILGIAVLVLIVVFVVPAVSPIFKAIFGAIGRFFRWIRDKVKSVSKKRRQRKNNRK